VLRGATKALGHLSPLTRPRGIAGSQYACQLAQGYGLVDEQFFGTEGTIETHRRYYRWSRPGQNPVKVDSKREITMDAIAHFLSRIIENKPENHASEAVESTLTSVLGRMAIDASRRITWEEMMKTE
jgi:hypothetical protein